MSSQQGKTSALPIASELAEMLEMGKTSEELAELFGVSVRTIRLRLSDAGLIGRRGPYRPEPAPPIEFDPQDETWSVRAACLAEDPEMFYPDRVSQAADALVVCARCPVRDECLAYAVRAEGTRGLSYRAGIWGGLTPEQRHKMSLAHQRTAS